MSEIRKLLRAHVNAMTRLHNDIQRVAITSGQLAAYLTMHLENPMTDSPVCRKADVATRKLGEAYELLAEAFDDVKG